MIAALRQPVFAIRERGQAVHPFPRQDNDASAIAPVSSIGTALGDILFSSEAHATISTFAGFDVDLNSIDKHNDREILAGGPAKK
jgi:hypothetical protein